MNERLRWEEFRGRRLLVVDASNSDREEAWGVYAEFDLLVRDQEDASVLFLFDVENAYHELSLTERWKQAYALHDRKVRRVAVVGAHAGLKVVLAAYRFFVRLRGVDIDRKMRFFDEPLQAKEWLIES